ncbi:hypothetical protein SAY86_031286 [Trapa natans]|uniref:non-specific serine/threonine protein kinase n=1 Tax=Trapa natans TaxID=22666 RepID=A0AAN7LLN7_TRANT|nr:hypothetical protein SAY86_031286 [Trapa natans]
MHIENLREYMKKHRQVSMKALKKWSKQIPKGLNYLHAHEPCIIHRNLNWSSNVFINGNVGQVDVYCPIMTPITRVPSVVRCIEENISGDIRRK